MTFYVMLAVWVVIGLLAGIAADSIWKTPRPYGEAGDFIIAIGAAILTGLADWYLLPLIGIEGAWKLTVAILEPALVALLVLWGIRKLKRA